MESTPYDRAGPARRALRQLVTTRAVAAVSARLLPRADALVLRRTRGRSTLSGWLTGLPIAQLGTIGSRTGLPRTSPVMAVPWENGLLVAAANFGRDTHPDWYRNLIATPAVTVTVRSDTRRYEAVELHGQARDRAFEAALRMNPGWHRFRARAGARGVPVLHLVLADRGDR